MLHTGVAPLPLSAVRVRAGMRSPLPLAARKYQPATTEQLGQAGLPAPGRKGFETSGAIA